MQETITNKVPTYVKNLVHNEGPKSDHFIVFVGVWAQRRPKVVPRTPRAPSKVKSCPKLYKNVCSGQIFHGVEIGLVPGLGGNLRWFTPHLLDSATGADEIPGPRKPFQYFEAKN